ncbi:MAG: folate-binding protein YgfZ [Devosiaceae bacterium]|nr:folate-binding protein YgfZ [Devosiaceae bacterium MH13]
MPLISLPHRALISVTGPDAEHLLEGLVTSALPAEGEATGSALLTPQGKILFTFLLSRTASLADGGFLLECDTAEQAPLMQRLTLYKLRAKVEIAPFAGAVLVGGEEGLRDLRHDSLPRRTHAESGGQAAEGDSASYQAQRIEAGVLEGPGEAISAQDFPHDVGLDLTGAVSFSKGCFVGQEVVSRVKHRGTARRRPVRIEGANVEAGAPVVSGEREIGTVRLAKGGKGLAVLRIDQIGEAVSVGGEPATLALPPYATYALGAES